jgi:hypothetical protein
MSLRGKSNKTPAQTNEVSQPHMDIKKELLKSVPTIPAKRLLIALLVLVPSSLWLLDEANPLWPNLNLKDLVIAKLCLGLFLTSFLSLLANIYYIYKLKKLGKFIGDSIPEMSEKFAKYEIDKFKDKYNIKD